MAYDHRSFDVSERRQPPPFIDPQDVELAEEEVRAEDRECLGHPAEDCGPAGEHASIGDVFYCDGSCRG